MRAVEIDWDTDGDMEALADLPTEIDIPEGISKEEISDYITDLTGYCQRGFLLDE